MRRPFKSGKFTLGLDDSDERPGVWWLERYGIGGCDLSVHIEDADLRHIERLCAKARAYRHRGKARHA